MPPTIARALITTTLLTLAALSGGCGRLYAEQELRVCRSIIPAMHKSGATIDIVDSEANTHAFGTLVRVRYRVAGQRTQESEDIFDLRCGFAPTPRGDGAPELTHLGTQDGPIGDLRLHLLKRFWIASGDLAVSDPEPVSGSSRAQEVPRFVALAVQHVAGALPVIGIYALIATAYALVYGLIGRINLAFGELTILGGYGAFLGYSLLGPPGGSIGIGAALAFGLFTAVMHGAALGGQVLGRLVDRPGQHVLIVTLALAIAWTEAMRLLQGTGVRWMPPLFSAPFAIARSGDFVVTGSAMSAVSVVISLGACGALLFAMRRSRLGRAWRATADDPFAAELCGVDRRSVLFGSLGISAAMAGLAGMLTTLTYGGVGYAGGLTIGLKALVAAVIGGIGSLPGAMAGAIVLGLAESLWSAAFTIESRDIAIFAFLALWLALRPQGIFGVADATAGGRGSHRGAP